MVKFEELGTEDRGIVIRALFNNDTIEKFKLELNEKKIVFDDINLIGRSKKSSIKGMIIESYPYLLDGLYRTFRDSISNEQIGIIVTNLKTLSVAPNLESNFGFNKDDMIEVGLSKLEKKRNLEASAIKNPEDYIDAVNDDLASIDKQAFIVYQQSFFKYHNEYKYESGRAKELAIGDMNVYKDMLLKQHKAIYDKTEFDNASKRIISNSKAK